MDVTVLFVRILIGGLLFMTASYIISKVQKKEHHQISFLKDFISGGIVISFAGLLVPDLFPDISLPIGISMPALPSFIGGGVSDDTIIQVGPPPLHGATSYGDVPR